MTRIKTLTNAAVRMASPFLVYVASVLIVTLCSDYIVKMLNQLFPYAEGLQFGEQRQAEHALWLLGTAGTREPAAFHGSSWAYPKGRSCWR